MPFFHEIPYEIQELAWLTFYGGRFELLIKGFIGECWLYDINSAYPHALSKIPDITCGKWVDGNKIHPKAALGFYHIVALWYQKKQLTKGKSIKLYGKVLSRFE